MEKRKKLFLLWEENHVLWIEIDWIIFFIESSTKMDSSSRSTPVRFIFDFFTLFRSILVVIVSFWFVFVEGFLLKIIESGFTQFCLRVVLLRVIIGSSFYSVINCGEGLSPWIKYWWLQLVYYNIVEVWVMVFSFEFEGFHVNFCIIDFLCFWFVS